MKLDRQTTYDIVRDHLMTQNAESLRDGGCAYRGDDGKMCAIGIFIPENRYSPDLEGWSVSKAQARKMLDGVFAEDVTNSFLCDLQAIHDGGQVDSWPGQLFDFAPRNGLRP